MRPTILTLLALMLLAFTGCGQDSVLAPATGNELVDPVGFGDDLLDDTEDDFVDDMDTGEHYPDDVSRP